MAVCSQVVLELEDPTHRLILEVLDVSLEGQDIPVVGTSCLHNLLSQLTELRRHILQGCHGEAQNEPAALGLDLR